MVGIMDNDQLIQCFRKYYYSLFLNSNVIDRQHINHIIYQSAPVQSRFANIAVNINPIEPITDKSIDIINQYFFEKKLAYTWIVNEDDNSSLINQLIQHGFHLMSDIECLYYKAFNIVDISPNIRIERVSEKNKLTLTNFIVNAFEGSRIESAQFFIDEVYFNSKNNSEVFFAYLNNSDIPVAYGAIYYYPNQQIAMLSGAATLPEYRGKGLYKNLLNYRMNQAKNKGYLHFAIEAMTKTSAPICKNLGFQKVFKQKYFTLDQTVENEITTGSNV